MTPAIFLDRDGVIVENRSDYVRSWDDVHIYPHALDALSRLRELPYIVVIVTNQSVVGRRLISERAAEAINARLVAEITEAGGSVDRVYMCPHAPWDSCGCRKPKPGMFLEAARELHIDLLHSVMVGDAVSDLLAARRAGVGNLALVLTGRGMQQALIPRLQQLKPFSVFNTLLDVLPEFERRAHFVQPGMLIRREV